MPFTPAHPAIVLPLLRRARRWLSGTALVIGTMSPDLEYFLRLRPTGAYGHSPTGILLLDIPLTLLLATGFHLVVKRPLLAHLPPPLFQRFTGLATPRWPRVSWLSLVISAGLGAGSHVYWDAFTHAKGAVVQAWPLLQQHVGSAPFHVYSLLQHGSTAVGLILIVAYVWRLPRVEASPPTTPPQRRSFWRGAALLALGLLPLLLLLNGYWPPALGTWAIVPCDAVALAVIIQAIRITLRRPSPS